MRNYRFVLHLSGLVIFGLVTSFAQVVIANNYLYNFPAMCSEAGPNIPLPGHVLRLGFVSNTPFGWSFLFPERHSESMLERVALLPNAGLIGQHPDQDFSAQMRMRTPAGLFVVADVFVGDPSIPPVVTCVSAPIPLLQYRPAYYGSSWNWLDANNFGRWLKFRKYGKWQWNRYWKFDKVRTKYKSYWNKEGTAQYNKYGKYYGKWKELHPKDKLRRPGGQKKTVTRPAKKVTTPDRTKNKVTILPVDKTKTRGGRVTDKIKKKKKQRNPSSATQSSLEGSDSQVD